jgi:MULE transposase domain
MPLFNIVGIIPNNMSFFAASAFFLNKTDINFEWVLQKLKNIYDAQKLPYRKVILTDADGILARAIITVFPIITHLLYI